MDITTTAHTNSAFKANAPLQEIKTYEDSNIRIFSYTGNENIEAVAEQIAQDGNVLYAQPNYQLNQLSMEPTISLYEHQWTINPEAVTDGENINVTAAWETTKGSIVVGLLDAGIDVENHSISQKIYHNPNEKTDSGDEDSNGYIDDISGWNFCDGDNNISNTDEMDKHGTAMASIIAANGGENGLMGVAPDVKVLPLKVISGGRAYTSDVIEAIEYANSMGIKIVNCSFGGYEYNQALYDAIQNSNMLFVCAAGNHGVDTSEHPIYPASFDLENVVSVGATKPDRGYAGFSNYGQLVDLFAPGYEVLCASTDNRYEYFQGTSVAAAHVTGVAALVQSANPQLTPAQVKVRLLDNTLKSPSFANYNASSGIVDAAAAISNVPPQPIEELEEMDEPDSKEITQFDFYTAIGDDKLASFLIDVENANQVGINAATGGISMNINILNTNSAKLQIPFQLNYNSRSPGHSSPRPEDKLLCLNKNYRFW